METVKAPECCPFYRGYYETFAICFRVYAKWNPDEVCQEKSERGPDWFGESFLRNDHIADAVIFPSYWMWQKVSTTFTQTTRYTGT